MVNKQALLKILNSGKTDYIINLEKGVYERGVSCIDEDGEDVLTIRI